MQRIECFPFLPVWYTTMSCHILYYHRLCNQPTNRSNFNLLSLSPTTIIIIPIALILWVGYIRVSQFFQNGENKEKRKTKPKHTHTHMSISISKMYVKKYLMSTKPGIYMNTRRVESTNCSGYIDGILFLSNDSTYIYF